MKEFFVAAFKFIATVALVVCSVNYGTTLYRKAFPPEPYRVLVVHYVTFDGEHSEIISSEIKWPDGTVETVRQQD